MNKCVYTCPMYRPPQEIGGSYYDNNPTVKIVDNRCRHCIGVKVGRSDFTRVCRLFVDEEKVHDREMLRKILRKIGRHRKRMKYRMKGAKNE